ncbi:tigger transposable element-derived protein 6-like [Ixodes scapularis]
MEIQDSLKLLYEDVMANKNQQDPRLVVALDIKKAFDAVPHWAVIKGARSCLGVFAVNPTASGNISKDSPRNGSSIPLDERSVELQKYQDFKRGLLYGSLVLVQSSMKNDSFRLCMMTYKPNTNLTDEGQIDLLTSSRNSTYREMVQGFYAETARRHNRTYRAISWLFRGEYYKSRVIFTDYKHCIILRTRTYNNLCELFTAGRHDSNRVNSWCFFIYTVCSEFVHPPSPAHCGRDGAEPTGRRVWDFPSWSPLGPPKFEKLEEAVNIWFAEMRSRGAAVSDEMLQEKAKEFGTTMDIHELNYSRGWLSRFKRRHGISSHRIHGESGSVDTAAVASARKQLAEFLAQYSPDDIYNFDETGFFYKLGPSSTLASEPVAGNKRSKERITVGFLCNASGTHKWKPIVVAKAERPRCFGKTFDPNMYCSYNCNKKAWMTGKIFEIFLAKFDRFLKADNRRAVLLVDNASCHSVRADYENLTLKFFPPNMTAKIQPLDAGIIRAVKAHYRGGLVRHYIACAEDNEPQTVDLSSAMKVEDPMDELPLAALREALRKLVEKNPDEEASAFLDIDEETNSWEPMSDEQIMELVGESAQQGHQLVENFALTETDDEEEKPTVTRCEARRGLETAIAYLEQEGDGERALQVAEVLRFLDTKVGSKASVQTHISSFFAK